jgi:hypothetical protein
VTLISQPGSDYQLAEITLDAGHSRDITLMLLDVHAVLDQLHLDGTQPQITNMAEAVLRESGSPYTLPALISALSEVIDELIRAARHATADIPGPAKLQPASDHGVGPNQSATAPAPTVPGGAKSKYDGGATSG